LRDQSAGFEHGLALRRVYPGKTVEVGRSESTLAFRSRGHRRSPLPSRGANGHVPCRNGIRRDALLARCRGSRRILRLAALIAPPTGSLPPRRLFYKKNQKTACVGRGKYTQRVRPQQGFAGKSCAMVRNLARSPPLKESLGRPRSFFRTQRECLPASNLRQPFAPNR